MAILSFVGAPHGGKQKLLPEWNSQPRITPTTIIDHSIVGSALGAFFFFRDQTGIESHFIIDLNGEIWQLMDTSREADANLEANRYAISIETADNGNPNTFPWTTAQLNSLTWLHNRLVEIHPTIPRKKSTSCTSGGLGYHSLHDAPSCWTPSAGKTCPGKPARVEQWSNILVPRFLEGDDGDVGFTDSDREKLSYVYDAIKDTADGQEIDLMSKLYRLTVWGSEAKGDGRPNIEEALELLNAIKAKTDTLP